MKRGYSLHEFDDREAEMRRLAVQADMIGRVEHDAMSKLGLPTRGCILDVGCGPGFVAARMQKAWPHLEIVGLDMEPGMLTRASRIISVARGDARCLPFRQASFDAVFARALLRHVRDPAGHIAEMARVTRTDGRVLVLDVDDGSILLDPVPDGFEELLRARHESIRRRSANPWVGRRLPRMMRECGLGRVETVLIPLCTEHLGSDAFARVLIGPAAVGVDEDLMSPDAVRAAATAIEAWGRLPDAFGLMTVFVVAGNPLRRF